MLRFWKLLKISLFAPAPSVKLKQFKFQITLSTTWLVANCLFSQHKEGTGRVIILDAPYTSEDQILDWGSNPTRSLLQIVFRLDGQSLGVVTFMHPIFAIESTRTGWSTNCLKNIHSSVQTSK